MTKNWIVAFGDSFTYGDELPDDDLAIENHHLRKTLTLARSYTRYANIPHQLFDQRNEHIRLMWRNDGLDYQGLCNSYSYINRACVQERIGCRNLAAPGRSFEHILIDLIKYFEFNEPSGELFVIGTGLTRRHTVFNEGTDEYQSINYRFMFDLYNNAANIDKIDDEFINYMVEYTNNTKYHEYMHDAVTGEIKNLLERKGRPYYLFDVKKRLDQITDEHKLDRCAFGHNDKQAHVILAEEMIPIIQELRAQDK